MQTACSTSLVAVHLAVQSLLAFECDMALAGGVTIEFPHGRGYEYQEGEILSPSGRCRAFDAESEGTVFTGGAAVVALRRLGDAYRDGDPILAVIKGSAVNNDGNRKVGYLAPSVDGHAEVVKEALAVAGVDPRTITLLEAHGTGTAVGDPIEVAALTEAFRGGTTDVGFCRLGSTKPNIGHLDTAAGTASLVKVVQALRHRTLPPIANHTAPSPLLDLDRSPFTLSATASPWEHEGPRRAGISSLGVGGTNAHVVVEEAPPFAPTPDAVPGQVLAISGLTQGAVDDATDRLADFFERHPDTNVADVAHTLAIGRRAMPHRRVVAVADAASAPAELRSKDRRRRPTAVAATDPPRIAFTFPGGGSQYAGMGAGLDSRFDVFHAVRDQGIDLARQIAGIDLAPLFEPDVDAGELRRPTASLPAVFVTSVALARQWMAWGVEPDVMIGHSLGEYAAAHLAGVFDLRDALSLVLTRSALMERASGTDAAMLVVPLPEAELADRLTADLSLATVNADDECVVAGPSAAIDFLAQSLGDDGVDATLIPLVAAAHSSMLDPVLDEFLEAVRSVRLRAPDRPYVSNVTGAWITTEQATDPHYWVDHLRRTVRFADGLRTALGETPTVTVELGPGQSLSSYVRRSGLATAAIPSLRHEDDHVSDTNHSLTAFAQLWLHGVEIDLDRFTGEGRRRLRLPTYPFQRERCWIEPGHGSALAHPVANDAASSAGADLERITDVEMMVRVPTWAEAPAPSSVTPPTTWLVVGDDDLGRSGTIVDELRRRGRTVRRVDHLTDDGHGRAHDELDEVGGVVVVGRDGVYDAAARRWLSDLPAAARRLGGSAEPSRLVAVTTGALAVGAPASSPVDALAVGTILVAPGEYPDLVTALVDLDPDAPVDASRLVDEIDGAVGIVAIRGDDRRAPRIAEATPSAPETEDPTAAPVGFRRGGTYLVTGGLGGIGEEVAGHLARTYDANLVIVSTGAVPSGAERQQFLERHPFDHPTCRRIRRLAALEQLGTKVALVEADLAEPAEVRAAIDAAEDLVGPIDGAVHAAGRLRDRLLETATFDDHRVVADAKARAALVLADELERRGVGLLVLVSSTSTVLAPEGQTSYVAANSVLDALAGRRGSLRIATIDFGMWAGTGMASESARRLHLGLADGSDTATEVDHPVLGEVVTDHHGNIVVTGRLATVHHWLIDEHRGGDGQAILPGTGHLELFLAAARAAAQTAAMEGTRLDDVALSSPLIVPDDRPVSVRVVIEPAHDGERAIRLDSDEGTGTTWTTHSEGTLVAAVDEIHRVDLDALQARCSLDVEPMASAGVHLQLGPRWSAATVARLGDGESFGRLVLPADPTECDDWLAHPALVDVATGLAVVLTSADTADLLHVPVGYDRVSWFGRVPAECAVHARRRPDVGDGLVVADVTVADPSGVVVMRIDGLQLRPVSSAAGLTAAEPEPISNLRSGSGLLELVDELGLRPAEALHWLDRLVSSDLDRIVVSSIDLDALASMRSSESDGRTSTSGSQVSTTDVRTIDDLLATMWVDLLGVEEISHDDDFFDLGGQSLIAIRLMTRIKRELGVRFQLSTIFEAPTVSTLAELVRSERPDLEASLATADGSGTPERGSAETDAPAGARADRSGRQLVTINGSGSRRPLYVVHGAGGNVLFLWSLTRALGRDQPVHGFQAYGINDDEIPDASIEAMAERYVTELRAHSPGPYLLAGYSGGGIVALEMVRQLQAVGETVDHVILFDSVPPGMAGPGRRHRWSRLADHLIRQGPGGIKPYLRSTIVGSLRRWVPERRERQEEHELQDRALGYRDVDAQGFVNLFFYFSATADQYEMADFDVDVTVLKADLVWPIQPDDYHWGRYVHGHLDWRAVPGDHQSMFYPENATALAAVVRDVLDVVAPVTHDDAPPA